MLIKRHHLTSYAETTLFRQNKGLIKYKSCVHLTSVMSHLILRSFSFAQEKRKPLITFRFLHVSDMPVQHIEVDASTLKARSRVVLTEEEVQLLTKVHSSESGSKDEAQTLQTDGSVAHHNSATTNEDGRVFIVENEETEQMEAVGNVYLAGGDMDKGQSVSRIHSSIIAPSDAIIKQRGRVAGRTGVKSNQPQVNSLLKQVTQERMTREVLSAVNSIQPEASPTQISSRKPVKRSPVTVKMLLAQDKVKSNVSKRNSNIGQLNNKAPQGVQYVPAQNVTSINKVTGQIPSIPVRGMQSLLKINQSSASQMVLKPDTLNKLKEEGVKGIRTRHIVYVVPKAQDSNGQKSTTEVRAQGHSEVIQSNMQSSDPTDLVTVSSVVEEHSSQRAKSPTTPPPLFILPYVEQGSPSKYITRANTSALSTPNTSASSTTTVNPTSNTAKDVNTATDFTVLRSSNFVAIKGAPVMKPKEVTSEKAQSQPTNLSTCVPNFIPDMTTPTKYANSLLPEMCVGVSAIVPPTSYAMDEEKARSEVDPYDIDKLIKDIQDDDVIGAEEPINEQDLEFMCSIQSSPTDSIIQAATAGTGASQDAQRVDTPTRGAGSSSNSQINYPLDWD